MNTWQAALCYEGYISIEAIERKGLKYHDGTLISLVYSMFRLQTIESWDGFLHALFRHSVHLKIFSEPNLSKNA